MSTDLMTQLDQLLSPHALGFDPVIRRMKTATGPGGPFPPYNVIKNGENYRIELAIAGYSPDNVEISYEDGILSVMGKTGESETEGDEYVVRNIAERRFVRKFTLADTVVIDNATFTDGILTINMHNELPEHLKSRKIEIEGVSNEKLLNE